MLSRNRSQGSFTKNKTKLKKTLHQERFRNNLGACSTVMSRYFLCFETLDCLLNLEPSRHYNKSSCKCLNRGLLDFGVPTPRPHED